MSKYKIIMLIIVVAAGVFAQIPPVSFYHQFSKARSESSNITNFSPYSYKFVGAGSFDGDTAEIYAIRVEFKPDSVTNTTGNGLFMRADSVTHRKVSDGIMTTKDRKEFAWYSNTYKYDKLPHDSTYFSEHLASLRNYYQKVSNGKLNVGWKIFPDDSAFAAYRLSQEMAQYSPGEKRRDETYDEFNMRISRAMMRFVAQSISLANDAAKNPFSDLQQDNKGRVFKIDANSGKKIPVFVLLIHAGSSILTDGGEGGSGNADSPNDLTDAFIGEESFKYFNLPHEDIFGNFVAKDPTSGKTGMQLSGKDEKTVTLSELMMVSETANQDSLNWGINGILVNQFARQLGIPDLYSTSSGISGIGRFGIMDFYGYSSANGFIPPNPSAFVRSFMGWETPIYAKTDNSYDVDVLGENLYLLPINNTEYYLIENRQRNLTADADLFAYDTTNGKYYIATDFRVNLDKNVDSLSSRSVVMKVKSRDIGIPASGVCVWHIDEKLIENRLSINMINADSSYRAVNLVEADGITDLGVEFSDMLGYPWYDHGSAADVFPHKNSFDKNPVDYISSTTAPATIANDGGNTFLTLKFANTKTQGDSKNREERYYYSKGQNQNSKYNEYEVVNISDSKIKMSVGLEKDNVMPVENFPVRIKNGDNSGLSAGFFPLLTANFNDGNGSFKAIVAISKNGDLTIVKENGTLLLSEKTEAVNMPTIVGEKLFVPCKNKILIYSYDESSKNFIKDSTENIEISSYIIGLTDSVWAVGTKNGELVFGKGKDIKEKSKISERSINAIAQIGYKVVAILENGAIVVRCNDLINASSCNTDANSSVNFEKLVLPNKEKAFPPFKIAVVQNIFVVSDSKNGLWFFDADGKMLSENSPVDWAGTFREESGRENIPDNEGYISAEDLNGDGFLEILIGGTNGVYAFDNKGNLLENYPAVLDRADWNIRKSVQATPITAKNDKNEPLVFFTTTTGDTKSYYQTKITKADTSRGVVYFYDMDGNSDSISGWTASEIDTLLTINDSIILPYFAPGGLIDIRDGKTGKRPENTVSTDNAGKKRVFPYLISIGASLSQGVVLDTIGGKLNLIAVSDDGLLYRFLLPDNKFPANQTNMVGGNAQRQFNFTATPGNVKPASESLEYFYSYPNPVRLSKKGEGSVTFRYELGDNASSAMLTIYTIQGQKVFEEKNVSITRGVNEFVLNDLSRFGSAVYRCRLSVKFGLTEKVLFWKMAVLR